MSPMQVHPVRVVVTGEAAGRSRVLSDSVVQEPRVQPGRPVAYSDVWFMGSLPPVVDDLGEWPAEYAIAPAAGALSLRMTQFDPMTPEEVASFAGRNVFAHAGSADAFVADAPSPFTHRTETVDLGIVMTGVITMVLDDGVVELGPGDVVVQRGTSHAWENRGDEPAVVAFVMVGATR